MQEETFSNNDFESLEKTLAYKINNAQSLSEIEGWLKGQKYLKSVQLGDYFLKSNPPQRDFIIEFCMQDGTTTKKIVNIFDLGNNQFRFHRMHDQS